jgi:NadR type nicotinamide-nucleotide adenylyltransferase
MIKVALTGSESTGKTELARLLGAHFKAPVSREFVREYAAGKGSRLGFADHGPIAHGQIASEDDAIARATDLVILDTDLISTVVYCEHYFGQCPPWIVEAARSRAADLYLLLMHDVPWQPDAVRDRGDRREEMHGLFAGRLRELGLTFVEIGGTWDERFRRAVAAVEAVLD